MANKTSQHIIGTALMLCSAFANASPQENELPENKPLFLNTTDETFTKHYMMGDYALSGNRVSFQMNYSAMSSMFNELKSSPQKYVAFSSESLGVPDREACPYVTLKNEEIGLDKKFLSANISIYGINTDIIPDIQNKNCVSTDKNTLLEKVEAKVPKSLRWLLK